MKIAVLGTGSIGGRHVLSLESLGHKWQYHDPRVASMADSATAATWLKSSQDRAELIDWSDAVIIATPSEQHHIDIADCLNAGKHVFVEKPIALTGRSGMIEMLVKWAEEKRLVFAAGFNLRFHPEVDRIKKASAQPYYASFICCQYTEKPSTLQNGCINEWACHEIDLARYLIGDLRIVDHRVTRFAVDLTLTERTYNSVVHIHSDFRAEQPLRHMLIATDKQSWSVNLEGTVTNEQYKDELAAFIGKIEGKDDPRLAMAEDGLAVLKLCERAEK